MAQWLGCGTKHPEIGDNYCDERLELIECLQKLAEERFVSGSDWVLEYVVPMFLTAFGLLKYVRACDNQIAARMTVLALATHVADKLLNERPDARS
jgi:hypothetical protein